MTGFFWYSHQDDGRIPEDVEGHFGLLRSDSSRKPAWYSYQSLVPKSDESVTGDLTGDGLINILDLQACVNHILGTQDWGAAADVNCDRAVNILDIQEIVNIILGV